MARVAVTGAAGFIGANLVCRLKQEGHAVVEVLHDLRGAKLKDLMAGTDLIVHLAGVNRSDKPADFVEGNTGFTETLIEALAAMATPAPLVYASSIHAERDTPYGRSKRAAEDAIEGYGRATGAPVKIYRLTNVFGKWSRPNYNSVVATFCHNIARGEPISIPDPNAKLRLVYIDDLVDIIARIALHGVNSAPAEVGPVYQTTVGELARQIQAFHDSRETLATAAVGAGYLRALHATYLSFLEPTRFHYPLVMHTDQRGTFVEMLRTSDCGQVSYFTAHPGVTRGGHYHHTKCEKFLVVQGTARFRFRNIRTDERFERVITADQATVVETVPGWAHDITNMGNETMIVVLWANEVFDAERPDTYREEL